MKLAQIDPRSLGDIAHTEVEHRARRLAFATGFDLVPGGATFSDVRHAVTLLAHYARTGAPPEGRRELVREYLQSLVDVDLVPHNVDDDVAELATEVESRVHTVVLGVLGREALADGEPIPAAQLAVLGGATASRVRQLLAAGELRRWKRGINDRRVYVHHEDAVRWLSTRAQ